MPIRLAFAALLMFLFGSFGMVSAQSAPEALPASDRQTADGYTRASRLGITFIASVDTPHNEIRYQRALELGAGWNRWPLYWDRVEPQPGRWSWNAYDELVTSDVEHGLRTNAILLGVPEFHRDDQTISNLYEPIFADGYDSPGPGKSINRDNPWARYVYEVAKRYRPGGTLALLNGWDEGEGIRVWEVWNEPDYPMFWKGGVRDYTRMLKIAHIVIHWVDPEATVLLGGLLYPTQDNWLSAVLNQIINDPMHAEHNWFIDAVAVHSYGNAWRSGWLVLYVRQTLVAFGLQRPIWMNETGVPAWDDYPGPTWLADDPASRPRWATMEQQAHFLIQSTAYAWAEGADVVFYHQLYDDCGDQPPGTNFPPHDGALCVGGHACFGDAFGIYRNPADSICFAQHPEPDTPRPIARAYRLLAEVFSAERFSRRGIVQEQPDGIVTITFLRPETGERIIVAWNTLLEPVTLELEAESQRLRLYSLDGEMLLRPVDGVYSIELEPALTPVHRYTSTDQGIDIGGPPVILVEEIEKDTFELLRVRTYENLPTPAPAATPIPPFVLSDEDITALMAASPTGVAFTSRNISRLRSAPSVEFSRVVGTMAVGESASVLGRTEDSGWLLIEYEGQTVWLAAFLGDIHGDLESVPVVDLTSQASAAQP